MEFIEPQRPQDGRLKPFSNEVESELLFDGIGVEVQSRIFDQSMAVMALKAANGRRCSRFLPAP